MRPIGEIKDEVEARRFGDFLYANEIHCDVDEDEDCWTIWIHDDDQIAKAESELAEFLKTPGHPATRRPVPARRKFGRTRPRRKNAPPAARWMCAPRSLAVCKPPRICPIA